MKVEVIPTNIVKSFPKLRFGKFDEPWQKKRFGDVVSIKSGYGFKANEYTEKGVPILQIENVGYGNIKWTESTNYLPENYLEEFPELKLINGDIVLALNRPVTNNQLKISKISEADEPSILYQRVGKFNIIIEYMSAEFLYQYSVENIKRFVQKQSIGSDQPFISIKALYKLQILVPSYSEQIEISSFLSAVDKKIQQLTRKKELLESYKKGVMQKLFSQEIRFKDVDGSDFPEWKEKKLSHFLEVSKVKNLKLKYDKTDVLSVSGQYGIVNQIEFQGRSFAGESVHNYGVVESGDIVYTKSPLKSNPYGIIKVNKDKPGIVSTLYAVYKCKPTLDGSFLDYYFQLDDNTNRYLRPLVQKGSKNDMKINNYKVLIDPVEFPSLEEQRKIVRYLEKLDAKIKLTNEELILTKTFKKGLLQQMFV